MTTIPLLIINPNTTQSITDTLVPLIQTLILPTVRPRPPSPEIQPLKPPQTRTTYFTAPTNPPSINSTHSALSSTIPSSPTGRLPNRTLQRSPTRARAEPTTHAETGAADFRT